MKRHILFSASLFHALNDAATVTIPMIFPILYSQKNIITRYSHIGILSTLGLLVTLVSQTYIAQKDSRIEFQYVIFFSITGMAVSAILLSLSASFISLLLIYVLFRFFTSFYHPVGISWVSKTYSGKKLDFAMGIQTGSGDLGVLIAFVSAGYLAQRFDWKTPLYAYGAAALVLGTAAFIAARLADTKQERRKTRLSCWKDTYKTIRFYVPGLVFGGACWATTVYYAPSLLHHHFSVPMGFTGISLALWIGAGTAVTYVFGTLSRIFGRHNIMLAGLVGATLSLLFLGFSTTHSAATISLFFFGVFLFLVYPAIQTYVGHKTPKRNQTLAFSIIANVQMLSGSVSGLICGVLSDLFGIQTPFIFLFLSGTAVSAFYLCKRKLLLSEIH